MAKKRKGKKKLIAIIVAIIVVIAGGMLILGKRGPKATEVTVDKVAKRDITSIVTASGNIEPKVEVTISSEVSGEVVEMPVEDGDKVKKGQLLVRIDTETLELQVAQQEAAIKAAKATTAQMKAQMDRTDKLLEDQKKLYENKYISADTLNEAQMNADVNKAAYEAALANVTQQQMELDEAKKNLSKAIIYSPMDGIISSRSVEIGDRVVGTGDYSGTEIMTVADYSVMNVEIDVNETDIVNVSVGDTASISIDAISGTTFHGEVAEIASSATDSDDEESAVTFLVKVRIDEPDPRIRPGMTATADIETDSAKGVLSVPLQSVTVRDKQTIGRALGWKEIPPAPVNTASPQGGKSDRNRDPNQRSRAELENLERVVFIYNRADGTVKLREVQTGISNSRYMEIKGGLSEGDEIVSGSYNAVARVLQDGMKVALSQSGSQSGSGTGNSEQGGSGGPGGPGGPHF